MNENFGRGTMKYLILISGNPAGRAWFKSMPRAAVLEATRGYRQLNEDLAASGEKITSEALADPAEGRRVAVVDGQIMTTDGPYAEAKEFLAGFYLLDCDSMERAIEHAAKLPEAAFGLVEVRPVMDLSNIGL
jgi:hypothetical protein